MSQIPGLIRNHRESCRYPSSLFIFVISLGLIDAETERRAVFNQYKGLTPLWPKLQACFGNTERMQSKQKAISFSGQNAAFPTWCFSNLS